MATKDFIQAERLSPRDRGPATFVRRDEFCQLLLSWNKLVRADEPEVNVCGLLDLTTGTRFLIDREELFERESISRSSRRARTLEPVGEASAGTATERFIERSTDGS
jgi:hypothetical protein